MGKTGVLASIGSFVVEISIQRRICELPGSSFVEEGGPSIGAGWPLIRPADLLFGGGGASFAGKRVELLGRPLGEFHWDR